jgi:hypothetical protein
MQRTFRAAIAAVAWACAAAAQGDPLDTRGGWEVGVQAAGYEYDEPFFATLEGERVGFSAAYTFLDGNSVHSRIEARYSYARLDYTGSGTLENVPDHLFEVRGLAGCDYRWGRYVWAPYAGVGFRYLYNDLRGVTSTGALGYRRRSRYFYLPIGLTLRIPLGANWVMAPQVEYDAFANGRQRTYLSDVDPTIGNATNTQGRGRGARAQLAFEGPRWGFSIWTHYWKIKNSDVQPVTPSLGILEPANTTYETGVELRYRF